MIRIANREIKRLLSTKLIEMNIQTPHTQRIIEKRKVKEIVDYQLSYIREHKRPNFLGVINIHYLSIIPIGSKSKPPGTYYLVDGQHRFAAIKELYEKYSHDLEILVEIVKVSTREELVENYNLINKNTPLPELPPSVDRSIPEQTTLHFQQKYPDVWSEKTRTRRPKVTFNSFQETLGHIAFRVQDDIDSSVKLIKEVEKVNEELGMWDKSKFKNVTQGMYDKAKKSNFFLGLLSYKEGDSDIYKWGDMIMSGSHQTKSEVRGEKKKKKLPIPLKVKNDSWDRHIGKEIGEAYCIVCDHTIINSKNFQAGHIISEKNGGKVCIDNLLPICGQCNRSMGTKNMREYVMKNYPQQLESFDNREYSL